MCGSLSWVLLKHLPLCRNMLLQVDTRFLTSQTGRSSMAAAAPAAHHNNTPQKQHQQQQPPSLEARHPEAAPAWGQHLQALVPAAAAATPQAQQQQQQWGAGVPGGLFAPTPWQQQQPQPASNNLAGVGYMNSNPFPHADFYEGHQQQYSLQAPHPHTTTQQNLQPAAQTHCMLKD